jgi:LTXXQ motif family protein
VLIILWSLSLNLAISTKINRSAFANLVNAVGRILDGFGAKTEVCRDWQPLQKPHIPDLASGRPKTESVKLRALQTILSPDLMKAQLVCVCVALLVCGSAGSAQEDSTHAGQTTPEIKTLSPDEAQGYLEGREMGQAKVAELYGYPAPEYVLELAAQLQLTPQQRAKAEHLKRSTKTAARLGYWLVEAERRLNALFAKGEADDEKVTSLVRRIGGLEAEIRLVHLRAHLDMRRVLTADQIKKYEQARGQVSMQRPP